MAFDDEDIITGEAVAIEVSAASFGSRMLGAAIDIFALGMVLFFLVMGFTMLLGTRTVDDALAGALFILLIVVTLVGVPTLVETLTRGRSLGKLALGLQIVRDDGGPIRFRHAFIRALVGVGEIWLFGGMVAVIVSLFHKRGKRLGDLLARSPAHPAHCDAHGISALGGASRYSPPARWPGPAGAVIFKPDR